LKADIEYFFSTSGVSYTSLAPPYRQKRGFTPVFIFLVGKLKLCISKNRIMAITYGTVDSVRLPAGLARQALQGRSLTTGAGGQQTSVYPASVLLLKLTLRQSRACSTRNFRIGTRTTGFRRSSRARARHLASRFPFWAFLVLAAPLAWSQFPPPQLFFASLRGRRSISTESAV